MFETEITTESGLADDARLTLQMAREAGLMLATAESCTGGLIAAVLTSVAGSSDVFERGFVTYSNAAKHDMLGVDESLIVDFGAVSEPVARAMAEGGLARSDAHVCVAVTGIAGPGGGTADKPVGRVHIAAARAGMITAHLRMDYGELGRDQVRNATVRDALALTRHAIVMGGQR